MVDHCGGAYLAAVIVDEDVAHDGEDPSFEINVVNILRFVVKHFEGCVLHEVSCSLAACRQLVSKVQKVVLKA